MSISSCAVVTLHFPYVVMGMVKTLDVWASVANYSQPKHVSLHTRCLCCVVDCSSENASITTVVPLWLVESVDRYNFLAWEGGSSESHRTSSPCEPDTGHVYIRCGIKYDVLYIYTEKLQ